MRMWGEMNEEEDLVCSLESGGKTRFARENIDHGMARKCTEGRGRKWKHWMARG